MKFCRWKNFRVMLKVSFKMVLIGAFLSGCSALSPRTSLPSREKGGYCECELGYPPGYQPEICLDNIQVCAEYCNEEGALGYSFFPGSCNPGKSLPGKSKFVLLYYDTFKNQKLFGTETLLSVKIKCTNESKWKNRCWDLVCNIKGTKCNKSLHQYKIGKSTWNVGRHCDGKGEAKPNMTCP